jgi:putative tricarboxylic transport membrane protein
MDRRSFTASMLGLAFGSSVRAADYPSRPIRLICTSAAGSPLDTMARMVAKMLGDTMQANVIVDNKVGGTGAVGMSQAMTQPADGHTLVTATGSTSFLMAEGKSGYSPSDFQFFRGLQAEPSSMAVRGDSPYRSMKDLVQALKKPDAKLSVGGFAAAGFHQFVFYRLQQVAGFETVWVPFQGGNQAVLALLGSHIDAAGITPSSALPQIESGDLRLLGISSAERDPSFPDVPTYREQGFDVVESIWRGLMVRTGTPPDVLAKLNEALDRIEASQSWKAFMAANKQTAVGLTSAAMQKLVEDEVKSRRSFLAQIGVVR